MVDGGRVIAYKFKLALGIVRSAGVFGDLLHAFFNQIEHFNGERAYRSLKLATVRNDVGGFARMNHGDRNNAGIHRLFVATDDGLESLHHLASHRHWINAVVRQRGMAALAANRDLELVA